MFEWIRTRLLRWLRVPPAPEPPLGAPGSVRVFRAGANFYKLRLFGWTLAQASTLARFRPLLAASSTKVVISTGTITWEGSIARGETL